MGRLLKMKRMVIAEANKRILNESIIDIDNVLHIMKFKFGWGDLNTMRVEQFEDWIGDVKDEMTDEEYANLFNDWLETESFGDDYNQNDEEDIYY
jgi:hypothetical protein